MSIIETGIKVLETEAKALTTAIRRIDKSFEQAVKILLNTEGRVVITGMGKSGLIGRKISATLTSTGSPSVYLHPSEALHGDIGIINELDSVMALSTSGETEEVLRLINYIKRINVKLIALVGDMNSTLAKESDVAIDCSVENEACPIGLVPSTSTTLTLAVGDALSIALMVEKGFSEEDFRFYHPGGSIGKKLLKVKHLMHKGDELPIIEPNMSLSEAVKIIDEKRFGVGIVNNNKNIGIITDGDIRRFLIKGVNFEKSIVKDNMTKNPLTICENSLAVEALNILEKHKITSLIVVDEANKLKGLLHLHDLWRTELV